MHTGHHQVTPAHERLEQRATRHGLLPGGNERILVLDDEPLVQKVNAAELQRLGYEVVCASSGEEAVDYLKLHHADLVMLDLVMSGMDGVETFKAIRRFKPEQKAIVYSGFAPPAKVREIQELGADPILIKPASLEKLAGAIRQKLDAPCRNHGAALS